MESTAQNIVVIEKIVVFQFGPFQDEKTFELDPNVNVITGSNNSGKSWLLNTISFMFDRRYEDENLARSCLSAYDASEAPAFVRLSIKTTMPVFVGTKERTVFTVTRFLSREKSGKIYINQSTTPVEIGLFHEQFPYVVIEEPFINYASTPNEFDLMRLWRISMRLDESKKLTNIVGPVAGHDRVKLLLELFVHLKERHDEEKAILIESCTLELAMLEKHSAEMTEHLRIKESRVPHKTRDEMRREYVVQYRKTMNRLQTEIMLNNHREECVHFNKLQIIIRTLLDKALIVPAAKLQEGKALNDKIAKVFTTFERELNLRVIDCRESQLFGTKRENYIRKFAKLTDLDIDANFMKDVDQRKAAIARLQKQVNSFEALMTTKGLEAFRRLQGEYNHWLDKLAEANDRYQNDRRLFVQHIERKYDAMIENLPKEIELLRMTGEKMIKGKMEIIQSLSEHFDFMNQETINGFKLSLDVLTNPATDPKFLDDLVGNVLDFIQLDKLDETIIKFVVPIILNILPMFVFKTKTVGSEFIKLVNKKSAGEKWWHCRVCCNDNYNDCVDNNRTPRMFQSLSNILLTDEVRRENRSVDFIFGQFLLYTGTRTSPNAQDTAIEWKKTLIFPKEKYYYTEDGHRIWIHNKTGDAFKDLLNLWHTKIRPDRVKLFECSREATALYNDIEKLKVDAKIDGFTGDISKLKELSREQTEQFKFCRNILDNLSQNTREYVKMCQKQAKLFCQHDARRLKLMLLQHERFTDEDVQRAAIVLVENISLEPSIFDGAYANGLRAFQLEINTFPLAEQKNVYERFKEQSIQHQATYLPERNNGIEDEPVDVKTALKNFEIFENLRRYDYQLFANGKRMAELSRASNKEFINADQIAELRELTYGELVVRSSDFEKKLKRNGIRPPTTGVALLKKAKKRSAMFPSAKETYKKSVELYNVRSKLFSSFKRATLRSNLYSMISIVKKMNDHGLSFGENRSIAIRLQSAAAELVIHCNSECNDIMMMENDESHCQDFDHLVDGSIRMNFVYVDPRTNEILVNRILEVNENAIAALFYLELGQELNEHLLILNGSTGSLNLDEMKFIVTNFGHQRRQILYVSRSHIDLRKLFPNGAYNAINLN